MGSDPDTLVCKVFGMPINRENEEARAKLGPTRIVVRKGYSRRSMAIELLNGEYEKMVLRIEELEKENKLLKKKSDNMESLLDVTLFIIDGLPSTIND